MISLHLHEDAFASTFPITDSKLETTYCPVCRDPEFHIIHVFIPFNVVMCKECELVYLNPRVKESAMLDLYHGDEYFHNINNSGYADYRSQEQSLRATFRKFLKELQKRDMTSGRLLEIGCGYGYFLAEAKTFFSSIAGCELSADAGTQAHKLSGANIHIGNINSLTPEWRDFDIIIAINVIEHIYSPVEFLLTAKSRLKKEGRIVIATPDIGTFWHKIMGKKWPSFKIPEHVAFYTHKTLSDLLKKAGFHNICRIPFPHAFPYGLIAHKLEITIPGKLAIKSLWLPKTMIALTAEVSNE